MDEKQVQIQLDYFFRNEPPGELIRQYFCPVLSMMYRDTDDDGLGTRAGCQAWNREL